MPRFRVAAVVAVGACAVFAAPAYAGSADVPVGSVVCVDAPVSGYQCGTVTAVDQTVNFPDGTVSGLTATDICVTAGDDDAPVYSGETLVGNVFGARDGCGMFYLPTQP